MTARHDDPTLVELDRRASVVVSAVEGYEHERATRSRPTLDGLKLLQAHAHAVADQVAVVLEEWFGDEGSA